MQADPIDSAALQARLDRNYRLQRHVYDLTRKPYLLGRDRLLDGLAPPPEGHVLEIGCGTGRNIVVAARMYRCASIWGVDLSPLMLEKANSALRREGLRGRAAVAHGDATNFDAERMFGRKTFDRIFLSYALSMIPDWQLAVMSALRHLAPGGSLHIVDFGTGGGLPRSVNALLRRWLSQFHVTPRDGLRAELGRICGGGGFTLELSQPFQSYAVLAVLRSRTGCVRLQPAASH